MSETENQPLTDSEAVALGRETLRNILAGKGTKEKSLHFNCTGCNRRNEVTVAAVDVGEVVKVTKYFDKIAKAGQDDKPQKARALLENIREMSDDELAQEFYAE